MARRPRIPRPPYDASTHHYCTRCRTVKTHAEFPRSRQTKTGLFSWCLVCNKEATLKWEQDPINKRRRRDGQALNQRRYSTIHDAAYYADKPVWFRSDEKMRQVYGEDYKRLFGLDGQ